MRKQTYTMIAAVVLLGCLAVSANAQCVQLTVEIPFQFTIVETSLPAGQYELTCRDNGRILLIRSSHGTANAFMLTVPVTGRSKEGARLVFHRYGSRYFFVQAWDGNTGLTLPTTRVERNAALELAGIKPKPEAIALTAVR